MVTKRRDKGRVVEVGTRVAFGAAAALLAVGLSRVSRAINTASVERQYGTGRHRNARKARRTYRFSKGRRYHEAVTYLSFYGYNFCWPVRTLAVKDDEGRGSDGARRWRPDWPITPGRCPSGCHAPPCDIAESTSYFIN